MRKIEENARKIGEFPRNPFLEVAEPKGDPAVVSGRFCGHSWRKSENFGEYRRKMENIGDIFPFLFLFIPFHSSTPRFSSPNVKSYLIIRFFVVNI